LLRYFHLLFILVSYEQLRIHREAFKTIEISICICDEGHR